MASIPNYSSIEGPVEGVEKIDVATKRGCKKKAVFAVCVTASVVIGVGAFLPALFFLVFRWLFIDIAVGCHGHYAPSPYTDICFTPKVTKGALCTILLIFGGFLVFTWTSYTTQHYGVAVGLSAVSLVAMVLIAHNMVWLDVLAIYIVPMAMIETLAVLGCALLMWSDRRSYFAECIP